MLSVKDRERFESKYVVLPSGCWQWTGKLDNGYGRFWLRGKTELAHRISWLVHRGPLPDGTPHLDHLCRNRWCVNPDHLEPVTIGENVLRGEGLSATNARKTRCKRDHPLEGENLAVDANGARVCVTCRRERLRKWRERNADKDNAR